MPKTTKKEISKEALSILALLNLLNIVNCLNSPSYKPVLLTELFRHGARATCRNPFHENYTEQLGSGNLTFAGLRQHFLLGLQIQKDYPGLFNKNVTNYDYELHTSPVPRCHLSMQAHVQGIYHDLGPEIIPEGFDSSLLEPPRYNSLSVRSTSNFALPTATRVFPLLSNAPEHDFYFFACRKYNCAVIKKLDKDQEDKMRPKMASHAKIVAAKVQQAGFDSMKIAGTEEWELKAINRFYDIAKSHYYYTGSHLKNLSQNLYEEMGRAAEVYWLTYGWGDDTVRKFRLRSLYRRVFDAFENRVAGKEKKLKYIGFSGHDTTIYPFLLAQKLLNEKCILKRFKNPDKKGTDPFHDFEGELCVPHPDFASSLMWELSKKETEPETQSAAAEEANSPDWYVRLLYQGKAVPLCPEEEADHYCSFKIWKNKIMKDLLMSDEEYNTLCGAEGPTQTQKQAGIVGSFLQMYNVWKILAILGFVALGMNCMVLWWVLLDRRRIKTKRIFLEEYKLMSEEYK